MSLRSWTVTCHCLGPVFKRQLRSLALSLHARDARCQCGRPCGRRAFHLHRQIPSMPDTRPSDVTMVRSHRPEKGDGASAVNSRKHTQLPRVWRLCYKRPASVFSLSNPIGTVTSRQRIPTSITPPLCALFCGIPAGCIPAAARCTVTLHAQPDRIRARIDSSRTVVLAGHVPPRARPEFDQGPVAASFPMRAVTIYLKPSASQQTSLEQLLANSAESGVRRLPQVADAGAIRRPVRREPK